MASSSARRQKLGGGFTLIELSIVLVIIGLLAGGIILGRDLLSAAAVRSQISQIEKYQAAVNTFKGKYGFLPGDMRPEAASSFGFTTGSGCDGTVTGKRNGNGVLETKFTNYSQTIGEVALFWQDLTAPIAGNITDLPYLHGMAAITCIGALQYSGTPIATYIPQAKIGGQYVYVYSENQTNWFGLSNVDRFNGIPYFGVISASSAGGVKVASAANIDQKIDDGLPTTGNVQALVPDFNYLPGLYGNSAVSDSTTSCYNTTSNTYSISAAANYGNGSNCSLSFKFQ